MINILACLKCSQKLYEGFLFILQFLFSLFFNIFHMFYIYLKSFSFHISEELSEREPIFHINIPHVL
jgi:hypothetical protein